MNEQLKPGEWIDDWPDPLGTAEDVRNWFERAAVVKARLLAESTREASLN